MGKRKKEKKKRLYVVLDPLKKNNLNFQHPNNYDSWNL